MPPKKFEIVLQPRQSIYYPGQKVKGWVRVIVLNARIPLKRLRIALLGDGASYDDSKMVINQETYVSQDVEIASSTHLEHNLENRFNFELTLPDEGLPCSNVERYAKIKYSLTAKLEYLESQRETSVKAFQWITIGSVLDLNEVIGSDEPVSLDDEICAHTWLCQPVNIGFKATLDRSAYVPGESIKIDLKYHTKSPRLINKVLCNLMKRITYYGSNGENFTQESMIFHANIWPLMSYGSGSSALVTVPPSTPTTQPDSGQGIMKIEYFIKIVVLTGGYFNDNIVFHFPVQIGTIPRREFFRRLRSSIRRPRIRQQQQPVGLTVNLPAENSEYSPTAPVIEDSPPPAYEDLFPVEILAKYPDIPLPEIEDWEEEVESNSGGNEDEVDYATRSTYSGPYDSVYHPSYLCWHQLENEAETSV